MKGRIASVFAIVLLAVGMAAPTAAGDWATVELDERPAKVVAGEPVTIGFQVLQHAIHPVDGAEPRLAATHRESGERFYADGRPAGAEGHYTATVTFPAAGSWKWSIALGSLPSATAFEALDVELPPNAQAADLAKAKAPERVAKEPKPQQNAMADATEKIVTVTINDGGFFPPRVEVARGTTIEWANTGGMPHQVMGIDLAFDDSNLLETSETFTRTLDQPGTYTYLCGPHQNMIGTIVVK